METPLLQLTNVAKSFGAVRALKGVSFSLRAGEVHALLGENGAGKSTLIKAITGAHQPDGGTIEIEGNALTHLNPSSAHKLGVACIYQQPALFPDLSVAENIALGLEQPSVTRRVRWAERREHARELLYRVGAMIHPDTEVRRLSMPEQQLVEIAKALGAGAKIVIMDEPTASLTHAEVALLLGVVRDLRSHGVGVIYISHRLDEIFAIADRVTVLRDGESVGTHSVATMDEASLIKLMIGREVSAIYPPSESQPGAVVASLDRVGCRTSGIRDVSLELRAGEVVGLAGLVGAGRTELARILFGITPADSGTIALGGKSVCIRSPREAVAHGIAYVPEDRRQHGVILEMPIAANMTMAIHPSFFPRIWLRPDAEQRLALDFIRDLGIKAAGPSAVGGSLSGGNQQKVALARWLATKPKLLILDEPTQGVDIGAKAEIHKLIRRLAKEGLAVLLISSDLPEVLGMSDRIAVMRGGTITAHFARNADAHEVMAAALGKTGFQPVTADGLPACRDKQRQAGSPPSLTGWKPVFRRMTARYFREWSVAVALALLLGMLAIVAPAFFAGQPMLSRLTREAPALVAACGMTLVILCRQIDISIGSQFAVCSVCAGLLAAAGWPLAVVLAVSIGLGALLGAVNGALVAGLRLPSIVVTLATMVIWREGLRWLRQGQFVNLPDKFQWFGLSQSAGQSALIAAAVLLLVVMALAMKHLSAGRFVYAVGSDAEAARLAGLRPQLTTFIVFVKMGALTGLAALMNIVQSPQVDPKSGSGLELKAIAAAVVGGVAISGGRGNLWGVFAGLLLLATINPALTYLHVEPYWEKAIQGAIILLAVVADGLRSRRDPR